MKKVIIAVVIAIAVVGMASAQPWSGSGQNWNSPMMGRGNVPNFGRGYVPQAAQPALASEKITLEGTLTLVDARVAIVKDSKTYFVMIPARLYGFVDGLKEGASVKVDGYSYALPNVANSYVVHVESLAIGGKTIDLDTDATPFGRMGMGRGFAGSNYQGMGMRGWR